MVARGADLTARYSPTDNFPDPVKPISLPRQNQTIMHIAAGAAATEVIEYLHSIGVPLDGKNSMDETPSGPGGSSGTLSGGACARGRRGQARSLGQTGYHHYGRHQETSCRSGRGQCVGGRSGEVIWSFDEEFMPIVEHNLCGRRAFLAAAAAGTVSLAGAREADIPIIDTHLHLYDPMRPQGVPYPPGPNPPQALPHQYREDVTPLGIVGGIKVEASPWIEDNLWVLETIANEPIMVGMIGDLDPTKPEFREYLDRYHRNKLFLGIRYGNVWPGHDLVAAVQKPEFIENMKAFAQTGLTLEVANPRFDLIEATVRLTDKVPDLRVVLGHLQALPLPAAPDVLRTYSNNLRELRKRKSYAKISGLPRSSPNGPPQTDPAVYKPMLDFISDIFGEDYLVFAAGWSRMPVTPSPVERMKANIEVMRSYFLAKGRPAAEKFFWKNSVPAFRWVRRDTRQPSLA